MLKLNQKWDQFVLVLGRQAGQMAALTVMNLGTSVVATLPFSGDLLNASTANNLGDVVGEIGEMVFTGLITSSYM